MESNLVIVANFVDQGTTEVAPDELTLVIDGSGSVDGVTNGQSLQIGQSYTIVATPADGWVFANWSGGVSGSDPTLTFVMESNLVIVANFVPQGGNTPFVPVAGVFHGLFFEPGLSDATHAGFFTLKLNSAGRYNAAVRTRGRRFNARGQFASDGRATNHLGRASTSALTVIWEADLRCMRTTRRRRRSGSSTRSAAA
jgi:hypothetical protein